MNWSCGSPIENDADWLSFAAGFPLAFAQVREDPAIDVASVRRLGRRADILMIGSGGCTACVLATEPAVASLHIVDFNRAQLALVRMKLRMLATLAPAQRLQLLGHASLASDRRAEWLRQTCDLLGLARDSIGPLDLAAEYGPDNIGRYEWLFARVRFALQEFAAELRSLLTLSDTEEQSHRVAADTVLGGALDTALESVMSLENLRALFGDLATANRRQPFSRHFAERIREALATFAAATNPYLWQMLLGEFPSGNPFPWLQLPSAAFLDPPIRYTHGTMEETLAAEPSARYDVVHLSNILDWLEPATAEQVLRNSARLLRPGGLVLIRQLNSTLPVRGLAGQLQWIETTDLHRADRSFFYRELHLGRLP